MDLLGRLRLDVPVVQAGMGGGLVGPDLAVAVANAGGLGTLGLMAADRLRDAISWIRAEAPGRAVAVNLLMPFVRQRHVRVCVEERIDVAVIAFGGDRSVVQRLKDEATPGISAGCWKPKPLTGQCCSESAGQPRTGSSATRRPAGGVTTPARPRRCPGYSMRAATSSPASATCRRNGSLRWQTPRLPLFSPAAPTTAMPAAWVDRTALYAGESVLRMESIVSARAAVTALTGGA